MGPELALHASCTFDGKTPKLVEIWTIVLALSGHFDFSAFPLSGGCTAAFAFEFVHVRPSYK